MFRKLEHVLLATAVGTATIAILVAKSNSENLRHWHVTYSERIHELATIKDKLERHIEEFVTPIEFEQSMREIQTWISDATE